MKYLNKNFIASFPRGIAHLIQIRLFLIKSRKTQFTQIYRNGGFGGQGPSICGVGSDLIRTKVIRQAIPGILRRYQINAMLDIPCGDLFWMQHVDLGSTKYIGADIVAELIQRNERIANDGDKEFCVLDICCDPLPQVDLILCRDCFSHLKVKDVVKAVRSIKHSRSKFLLITNYSQVTKNTELGPTFFRPLNLCKPPFSFPLPLESIYERDTEREDKCLGLWRIADLPMI
jgi:hypothetical protein